MPIPRLPLLVLSLVVVSFGCAERRAEIVPAAPATVPTASATELSRPVPPLASNDERPSPSATAGTVGSVGAARLPISKPQHPGNHPGSYSPNLAPPPWDEAAYRRDPAGYCNQFMPGRCHQTAMPAADVPFLEVVGPQSCSVRVADQVIIAARTAPGMPVTFTSFGLGAFPVNGLTSLTVQADAMGLAKAVWAATPGTIGAVKIVSGSPVRAGNATYLINVQE